MARERPSISLDYTQCRRVTLVSRLQALRHSGDLRIPRLLPDAVVLALVLQESRVKYTEAGNATFNAR